MNTNTRRKRNAPLPAGFERDANLFCSPSRLRPILWFGISLLFWESVGCVPRSEKEVVLYTSADREFAGPILDSFDRLHDPTTIARQFDVESTKTVGLVTRIMEEKSRPRCDVFWNNEILHTIRLQKAGLLRTRRWSIPDGWPEGFRAKDGTWVGIAGRARVLIVNTDRLPKEVDWPQSVDDLRDPKWQKKCGVAFPLFGTTATHFAVQTTRMPASDAETWFKGVATNAVVLSGNKQVAQAVARGELDWGLTDTDDALVEKENGMKIAWIFPDQRPSDPGTLLIPNTVAVLDRSPHPIAAAKLADFLVSQKTEERLTMGNAAQFPLWPGASKDSAMRVQQDKTVRWMKVDFEEAANQWEEWAPKLKAIFGR